LTDIGDLFRDYGEEYIRIYNPSLQQIKLIRSIRICQTPFMGGKRISCTSCNYSQYIYLSCGNSQCPLCQGIKRIQWQDKLKLKLLKVPYVHTTFTMPHELNGLARCNQKAMYGLIMRVSWLTIKALASKEENIGGLPGMSSVLHTFGSDLKYHIHVHCLITFGGIDKYGKWQWPRRKHKLASYREMSKVYRAIFLKELKALFRKGLIEYHLSYNELVKEVKDKTWVVHNTYPTTDTKVISEYLGRYICRIGISKNRIKYDKIHKKVTLEYNDYRHQKKGKAAPKAYKKLPALVMISQILQHVCPPYFTKSRHQGLHSKRVFEKYEDKIKDTLKEDGQTVRRVMEIITQMIKVPLDTCPSCGTENAFTEIEGIEAVRPVRPQRKTKSLNKSPPLKEIEASLLDVEF